MFRIFLIFFLSTSPLITEEPLKCIPESEWHVLEKFKELRPNRYKRWLKRYGNVDTPTDGSVDGTTDGSTTDGSTTDGTTDGNEEPPSGDVTIAKPTYDGVDQLLVLSDKWVIVATKNVDEVIQKIDELSGGVYIDYVNTWSDSLKANPEKPDWTTKKLKMEPLYNQHIDQARELAGERELEKTSTFTVTSSDDSNYSEGKQPVKVTRQIISLGKNRVEGLLDVDYAHYSYMELPSAMQSGNTYTITLNNGKSVTFLYDELRTIARSIKTNQVGYIPNAKIKYAYLGAYLQEFGPLDFSFVNTFHIFSADSGKKVYTGTTKLRDSDRTINRTNEGPVSFSGEDVYEMDLSGFNDVGNFFISVPGVGRSWTFKQSDDVYGKAFFITARALYHQRSGMAIDEKYSAWPHEAVHTEPVYEAGDIPFTAVYKAPSGYNRFDVIGGTIDMSKKTDDARGGWYDAADWDKNIFHYTNIVDLLGAFQVAPQKFKDGQLNISDSGNGIPDILDEAEYGLRVWLKSMTPEGGVAGTLEARTHTSMHSTEPFAYSKRTRWSSLLFAGSAAWFAKQVAPFNAELAEQYAAAAMKAFNWGNNPANSLGNTTIHAKKNRGDGDSYTLSWEEKDEDLVPYLIFAKLNMYRLTQNESYLDGVGDQLQNAPEPLVWPFRYNDYSTWLYYAIFSDDMQGKIPATIVTKWKTFYLSKADEMVNLINDQTYRQSWKRDQYFWMAWGATAMTNEAKILYLAYLFTEDDKYRSAAIANVDFALGNNAMGMSWTTGLGSVYPIDIQHALSEFDGIWDPVPGIPIYGITGGQGKKIKETIWQGKNTSFVKEANKNTPLWREWLPHPLINVSQNEFTIHETLSSAIFTYGMLMPDGWMPSEQLKDMKPKPKEDLHGLWYLP